MYLVDLSILIIEPFQRLTEALNLWYACPLKCLVELCHLSGCWFATAILSFELRDNSDEGRILNS